MGPTVGAMNAPSLVSPLAPVAAPQALEDALPPLPRREVQRARRTALAALGLGLLVELFFDGHTAGVSFPLTVGLGVGAMLALTGIEGRQKARPNLWLLAPIGFLAVMVGVRESAPLVSLNILTVLTLLLTLAYSFAEGRLSDFGLLQHALVPLKAACSALVVHAPSTLSSAVHAPGLKASIGRLAKPVILGLFMAMPVVVIFTALLCSADPRFGALIVDALNLVAAGPLLQGGMVTFGAMVAIAGLLGLSQRVVRARAEPTNGVSAPRAAIEGITFALTVDALFVAFALTQAVYLFHQDPSLSGNGITYSSYARGGFFELLAVSMMTLALILALVSLVRPATPGQAKLFKSACSAMAALVGVLLVSAIKRMALYEEAYGYTALRVYSHVFMFALGAAMLWRAVTFWWKPERFAFGAFLCGVGFVMALNVLNPDAFIARGNLERQRAGETLDYQYLNSLSADATPVLADATLTGDLPAHVVHRQFAPYAEERTWPSFNLSRWWAQRSVDALPPPAPGL